jgi:geranylgeranyl pyrophosphate synthase
MIGGQTLDILSEGKRISEDILRLSTVKNGCLLTAPFMIPVFLADNSTAKDFLTANRLNRAHIGLRSRSKTTFSM